MIFLNLKCYLYTLSWLAIFRFITRCHYTSSQKCHLCNTLGSNWTRRFKSINHGLQWWYPFPMAVPWILQWIVCKVYAYECCFHQVPWLVKVFWGWWCTKDSNQCFIWLAWSIISNIVEGSKKSLKALSALMIDETSNMRWHWYFIILLLSNLMHTNAW